MGPEYTLCTPDDHQHYDVSSFPPLNTRVTGCSADIVNECRSISARAQESEVKRLGVAERIARLCSDSSQLEGGKI
jgi:hypothetical protein